MSKVLLLTCEVCSKHVTRYPSTLKSHVYCSKQCTGVGSRNGSELFCEWCDEKFYRRFGEQDREIREHQFCSRSCYFDWRAESRKDSTYPKIDARHEHRIVAERFLGRALMLGEVVHHIDGHKHNNEPENLMVLPDQSTHMRVHFGRVSDAELRSFPRG